MLKEKLDDVLTQLTERERKILEMRFGLVDGYGHTLEEIGNLYNVTRERIRQIEAKALRKLRHPTRAHHLHGFLETHQEASRAALELSLPRASAAALTGMSTAIRTDDEKGRPGQAGGTAVSVRPARRAICWSDARRCSAAKAGCTLS